MTTTNNKRVILRKEGNPIPTLSKWKYPLWKLAIDLSLSELSMLIIKRSYDIKYETSQEKIKDLRGEILLLNDAYKIKKRENLNIDKSKEVIHIGYSDIENPTISTLAEDIIAKLNYSQNTLFKTEVIAISNKIDIDCDDEILATCIVKCVLDKYNSKFDESELLKIHNIPEILFYKCFITVSLWCDRNYWRR